MGVPFEDDDDLTRAKIARPTPTGTPLTLRGVPSPGSTANLEDSAAKIPSQMGASLRTATQPEAPSPLEKQTSIDRAQQTNLDKGSGISQIANPWARNTLRGVNVLGSVAGAIIPQIHSVMGAIPGTEEHHQRLVGQNNAAIGLDEGQAEKQAQTAHEQAQTQSLPAEADYREAQADNLRNPQPKPKEEDWTAIPGVTGANGELLQQEKNSGQVRLVGADKIPGGVQPLKPPTDRQDSPEQQFINSETARGIPLAKAIHDYAIASQRPEQPQRPQQQLAVVNGKVVELKPGMDVPGGTKSLTGELAGNKPTADETRRADMADNLNENLNALEGIVTNHPELFGPVAGRVTGLRGMVGSNNPEIGALEAIKHQIGMVQISTHGMRSAQGISAAADSILNSFHNGPEAVKAAITAARNSASTFQQDAGRNPGTTTKSGPAQGVPADAPQAPREDGHKLKVNGQVIAISKGGQWAPLTK